MERLSFVLVDSDYCDFLRQSDPCVPYNMDNKSDRPFVGVLLCIRNTSYYAPLSSPKPKHLQMKNQIDLLKIDGGKYGVINFNNMIPIHIHSIIPVDIAPKQGDSPSELRYKALLTNQITWCNSNRDYIISKAQKLYETIVNNRGWESLVKRCCNFVQNEELLRQYCLEHEWQLFD